MNRADLREKLILDQKVKYGEESICPKCFHHGICRGENNQPCFECDRFVDANGVTVQEWIPVEEQKPEENKNVKIYMDGNLLFASVLVCGSQRGVTIANRVNIQPVGIPYLDEHATNGWKWSVGNEDVTHWMPLPEAPKEVER